MSTWRRTAALGAAMASLAATAACSSSPSSYAGPAGQAALQGLPDGVATVTPSSHAGVTVALFGLEPGVTVTLTLVRGTCLSPGSTLATFGHGAAKGDGTLKATLTSTSATPAIPSQANVTVVQGGQSIGCTDLTAGKPNLAQRMYPIPSARAAGKATATTDKSTGHLRIDVTASGIAGSGAHPVVLLSGHCASEGDVVAHLGAITPKSNGTASATVTGQLPGSAAAHPWSVEVLVPGQGKRPLLCADLPAG